MTDYVADNKTYVDSYSVFRRGLARQQQAWMATEIIPELKSRLSNSTGPTLNILAFGSGFGEVDILFLKELKKQLPSSESLQINYTVVERNEEFVSNFKDRVKSNADELKNITFTWKLKTCEEFLSEGDFVANSYHLVHFIHVLYYVDIRDILKQCMSKLLSSSGCLLMVVQTEESLYATNFYKYKGNVNDAWTNFHIVTNEELISVATENNWRCLSFDGDREIDITDVFKPKSTEGGMLIDFFFHAKNLVSQLTDSQLKDILDYFKSKSYQVNDDARYFAKANEGLVLYFK